MDQSISLKAGKGCVSDRGGHYLKGREGWGTIKGRGGQAEDSVMSSMAPGSMTGLIALWTALVLFLSLCLFDFDRLDINCLVELRSEARRKARPSPHLAVES